MQLRVACTCSEPRKENKPLKADLLFFDACRVPARWASSPSCVAADPAAAAANTADPAAAHCDPAAAHCDAAAAHCDPAAAHCDAAASVTGPGHPRPQHSISECGPLLHASVCAVLLKQALHMHIFYIGVPLIVRLIDCSPKLSYVHAE